MRRLPKKLQTDALVVYKRYRFSRVRHETFKETERAKARRKERRFVTQEEIDASSRQDGIWSNPDSGGR